MLQQQSIIILIDFKAQDNKCLFCRTHKLKPLLVFFLNYLNDHKSFNKFDYIHFFQKSQRITEVYCDTERRRLVDWADQQKRNATILIIYK